MQGNYVGMTEEEMAKCDPALLAAKIKRAQEILYKVNTPEYPVIANTGVFGLLCPFLSF